MAIPPRQISFSPSEDTFVPDDMPGKDNGSSMFLRLRARGKERALVKFDTAAITAALGSSTVLSAKLVFAVATNWKNWEGGATVELYPASSLWSEHTAVWDLAALDGTPGATAAVSNDTAGTLSFEVTSDVKKFLAGGNGDDGWILKKANECAPGAVDLGSRESDTPPKLVIDYQDPS